MSLGLAVDGDDVRLVLAQTIDPGGKAGLEQLGSNTRITSPSVSWLGAPCANGRNWGRNGKFWYPQRCILTKIVAPAKVAQSSRRMISGSRYSTFATCRGSSSAEK